SPVTQEDADAGQIDVQSIQLDDGTYEFIARIIDGNGDLVAEAPVHVTIVTDRDGVQPSIELTANNGDFNQDGIADWRQNNVAQLPITSVEDFIAGSSAPSTSFGAIIAGDVRQDAPAAAIVLDPSAQLLDLSLTMPAVPVPDNMVQASVVFNFSVTAQDGDPGIQDLDASRAGVQTRVVIELPQGVNATGYVKFDSATQSWFSYMDDGNLATYDDGATLLDINGDGKVDRVVITLTDGGVGDDDHTANGMITDPGMLVLAAAGTPVYDVKLASGDHYYTTSAVEAANLAQGSGNVFMGAAFDSLSAADGGHTMLANFNPFTMDWYFAKTGDAMPYVCYEAKPGAGFGAASAGQGPGTDYHLFLNANGMTQLVTTAQATSLGLAAQGYADKGAIFNTTATGAFAFDVEGYLLANSSNQAVRDLVHTLSQQYAHTSDAGFVDAVEHDYLARVQLTGIAHGGNATAADVNAAFGTTFTA
ncbi:MAG TPA: choice-of-anchor U domain-containing protein, partial [Ramlibacter sp.]|nr:choice-of-anchor U domain-containing protein [Ramlibacter sp.]